MSDTIHIIANNMYTANSSVSNLFDRQTLLQNIERSRGRLEQNGQIIIVFDLPHYLVKIVNKNWMNNLLEIDCNKFLAKWKAQFLNLNNNQSTKNCIHNQLVTFIL